MILGSVLEFYGQFEYSLFELRREANQRDDEKKATAEDTEVSLQRYSCPICAQNNEFDSFFDLHAHLREDHPTAETEFLQSEGPYEVDSQIQDSNQTKGQQQGLGELHDFLAYTCLVEFMYSQGGYGETSGQDPATQRSTPYYEPFLPETYFMNGNFDSGVPRSVFASLIESRTTESEKTLIQCYKSSIIILTNLRQFEIERRKILSAPICALVEMKGRPSVARIVAIPVELIFHLLYKMINRLWKKIDSMLLSSDFPAGVSKRPNFSELEVGLLRVFDIPEDARSISDWGSTLLCEEIWDLLGLTKPSSSEETHLIHGRRWSSARYDPLEFWLMTLELIDIILLNHFTSHSLDYDQELGIGGQSEINLTLPQWSNLGFKYGASLPRLWPSSLACLSQMLEGRRLWIWGAASSRSLIASPVSIQCTVETFAMMWGEVRGVKFPLLPESDGGFASLRVAGGFIVPWLPVENQNLRPIKGELLCHWVPEIQWLSHKYSADPDDALDSQVDFTQVDEDASLITAQSVLLIGADALPRRKITTCSPKSCPKHEMRLANQYESRSIGSQKRYLFFEPQYNLAVQAPHVQGQLALKPVTEGITSKQGLIDEMVFYPSFNPGWELERLHGILVSKCTLNAYRVRVRDLLKTKTMRNFLAGCEWTPDGLQCRFDEALQSPKHDSIWTLWESEPSVNRETISIILRRCLRVLARTGTRLVRNSQHLDDHFDILWMPDTRSEMTLISLKEKDHPWTKLVRDNERSRTMAVFVDDHVELPDCDLEGMAILKSAHSWLETAVEINSLALPSEGLQLKGVQAFQAPEHPDWTPQAHNWQYVWKIQPGNGASGELKVVEGKLLVASSLGPWYLVTKWEPSKAEMAGRFFRLNRDRGRTHSEFLTYDGTLTHRPIPVYVLGLTKKGTKRRAE